MKLALANFFLFIFGVFVPCLKITPHLGKGGDFDFLGKIIFGNEFDEKRFSIAQGILELIQGGDYFIGAILFLFTLAFPAYKMYLTFFYYLTSKAKRKTYEWILKVSKYSMLDIFVLGLIVLAIKAMPGGTTASLEWGAFLFFANIVTTKYILGKISKDIDRPIAESES